MFEYINKHYGVSAQLGGKILYRNQPAVIVKDFGARLGVKILGSKEIVRLHPTWEVKYLNKPLSPEDKKLWLETLAKYQTEFDINRLKREIVHYKELKKDKLNGK